MKVSVSTISLSELDVDLLIVPVTVEDVADGLDDLVDAFGESVERARGDLRGEAGDALVLYPDSGTAKRIVLTGIGEESSVTAEALRSAAAIGARTATRVSAETVGISVPSIDLDGDEAAQALVEGFVLGLYRFDRYRTKKDPGEPAQRLVIHAGRARRLVQGARRGCARLVLRPRLGVLRGGGSASNVRCLRAARCGTARRIGTSNCYNSVEP